MLVRRILCPIDFSSHSRVALEHAEFMAATFGAELLLVHVVEPIVYPSAYGLPAAVYPGNLEDEARAGAQKSLDGLARDVAGRGVKVRSLVDAGTASSRICALVEEHHADLVVMATHGLTGLQHLLLGSTAERVVRHCPAPVLTVKGATEARART